MLASAVVTVTFVWLGSLLSAIHSVGWATAWRYRFATFVGAGATLAIIAAGFTLLPVWPLMLMVGAVNIRVNGWIASTAQRQRDRWEASGS
jgi:hypothetical protein